MKISKPIWSMSLGLLTILASSSAWSQCSFTGLDATYCVDDDPVTMVGDPADGVFSGPGVTGDEFDPAAAGPGVHTVTYTLSAVGDGDKYYIKAAAGNPWGSTTNQTAMDNAFGIGAWTEESFEGCDPAAVFSPTTAFVFMDGSDSQASELATFLAANLPTIEDWVNAGGRLLLNSAPNEGGNIPFGFDGTLLNYAPPGSGTHVNNVTGVDPAHPAFLGPDLPTATDMTGTYYGHAIITGVGLTDVLTATGDLTKIVLTEKCWGAGKVMFGGMTTFNWHNPDPQAEHWRGNIMTYLYENPCGGGDEDCIVTQDVEVFDLPDVALSIDDAEICIGEEVVITGSGADDYVFDPAAVASGVAYTPPADGDFTVSVIGTDATSGCSNTATIDFTVHPLPDLAITASEADLEVCFGDELTLTGTGADTYTWDMGVDNGVPFTPGPIGTNNYTVTGTDELGCVNTASIAIDIVDCEPVYAGFTFDNNICVGDCITFTDTSVGTTINSWEWDFGGAVDPSTSSEVNPSICFNTIGEFTVSLTITSLYGQVSTATHTLTVNSLPVLNTELDTIITLGGDAWLIATADREGEYLWSPDRYIECPDCGTTTASPLDSTMYEVFFIDENGCTAEGQVMVLVNFIKGVGVPSAFSPNGDGNNDILLVKGRGIEAMNFVVYNRYGEVVFESNDQTIGWDGTHMGRDVNPGVFTWVLFYDFYTGEKGKQQGNTTLYR